MGVWGINLGISGRNIWLVEFWLLWKCRYSLLGGGALIDACCVCWGFVKGWSGGGGGGAGSCGNGSGGWRMVGWGNG